MWVPLRRAALPRTLALALVLGAAAACADAPTASRATSAPRHDAATAVTTLRRPTLISNHVKYRDAGAHPASGKAGAATLYMQALLGRDGKTEVQVATSELAFRNGWGPGEIAQLQVKALGPDGHPVATRVHTGDLPGGGTATFSYGGMARGTTLRAQAAVRGLDPHRTDVPVATGQVRLRPNLAVKEVTAPERVRVGAVLTVSATIAETNGDVGEFSDCLLYVDGQQTDGARWIWVDAGDAVTCFFYAGFLPEGRHQLEVRLSSGLPRDDDPADNAASTEVEVYSTDEMFYDVYLNGSETTSRSFSRSTWFSRDGEGIESSGLFENHGSSDISSWSIAFYGWANRGMSQAPRVEVEEETNGARVFSGVYDMADLLGGSTCGMGVDPAAGVSVFACTGNDPLGYTMMGYFRSSTRVSYHSHSVSRYFDGYTGEEQVYHDNYDVEDSAGLPLPELGSDYTLRVRVGDGTTQLSATTTFPVSISDYDYVFPWTCTRWEADWATMWSEYCWEREERGRSIFGVGHASP